MQVSQRHAFFRGHLAQQGIGEIDQFIGVIEVRSDRAYDWHNSSRKRFIHHGGNIAAKCIGTDKKKIIGSF